MRRGSGAEDQARNKNKEEEEEDNRMLKEKRVK